MEENRIDARYNIQKEKYSLFFIKNAYFKEKIKVLNISKIELLFPDK
jgi:hypothetical protein